MQIRPVSEPDPVDLPPEGSLAWRVPGRVILAKFGLAAFVALLALVPSDPVATALGVAGAVGLAAYAMRDLVARLRLVADDDGVVVVRGYAGRRRLAWTDLERVRMDARPRLGTTTRMLELDAGTEIYLLSQFDLGAQPEDVFEALVALRPELAGEGEGLHDGEGDEEE